MTKKYLVDTKRKIIFNNKSWAIILVAQFLLFYALSKFEAAVQVFLRFYEWKKNLHNSLFSGIGFSVGDVLYLLLGIFLIYLLTMSLKTRKSRYISLILILINVFYLVYQCCWGMMYFQPPIIQKLSKRNVTDSEIKALTIKYLNLCKTQREVLNEDNNGIFKVADYNEIQKEILRQQESLPNQISSKDAIRTLNIKPSLFNRLMNKTGILGYYNPFTSEAQYNPNIPSTQLPFTMAHEMSHQLGFAREQEASFIGFLCAEQSSNKELQYSANYYALKSLIRAVSMTDLDFAKQIIVSFSDRMKRDRAYELKFSSENEGITSEIFGVTNDLFLKSNQQEGSITYSYFVNLLILYKE